LKIKELLNRTSESEDLPSQKEIYQIGTFEFNPNNRLLSRNDKCQKLSPKEAMLLDLLCRYMDKIMPRDVALNTIWKQNDYFTIRCMAVYIGKLRKFLFADENIKIETFHQMGFQLMIN